MTGQYVQTVLVSFLKMDSLLVVVVLSVQLIKLSKFLSELIFI